jgi:hypothetical protein
MYQPVALSGPPATWARTRILLDVDDGVIETDKPVTSTGVKLVVVKASSFTVCTT